MLSMSLDGNSLFLFHSAIHQFGRAVNVTVLHYINVISNAIHNQNSKND